MGGWVYIVTNRKDGTLYVGVKSDIARRSYGHRAGLIEGFTRRCRRRHLVWIECHDTMLGAIRREKSIKHWAREWKVAMIEKDNPDWRELHETLNV